MGIIMVAVLALSSIRTVAPRPAAPHQATCVVRPLEQGRGYVMACDGGVL